MIPAPEIKRPALRYHGGKFRLAPWILSFFPEHDCYVEPFGGAASVLVRKPRSKVEVYNDLDGEIVNFFRILRDPTQSENLAKLCFLTPFSREEFAECYNETSDPVERARRLVARSYLGFGSHSHNAANSNGFRTRDFAGRNYAREWAGVPEGLLAIADRFRGVTIENLPAINVISKYDSAGTLFYIDPPYPSETRNCCGKGYAHEMTNGEHQNLAWMLHRIKGKAIVSGYNCAQYHVSYSSWRREEKETTACGQNGSVARTEVLWMNF